MMEKEVNKDNNYDADVKFVEECLLDVGMERMSRYFGNEVFKNGISARNILWNKDDCYYTVSKRGEMIIEIGYGMDLGGYYEVLDSFSIEIGNEEIKRRVTGLVSSWTPAQEKILNSYIDMYSDRLSTFIIQGVYAKEEEDFWGKRIQYIENEYSKYVVGINWDLDVQYDRYISLLEEGKVSEACFTLQKLYSDVIEILGKDHSNVVALLYELREFVDTFLSKEDSLKIGLKLYQCNKRIHGNYHLETICAVSSIAASLRDLKKYDDCITLAKYVQKICDHKYGEKSERNVDAMGCLMSHYYAFGRYGKALLCAEKCLEICKCLDHKDLVYYMQCIAIIYRTEAFEDYENALQYDEAAYKQLLKVDAPKEDMLGCIDTIVLDYMNLGRVQEALQMQTILVEISTEVYGTNHLKTLEYTSNLSVLLTHMGQFKDALEVSKDIYYRSLYTYGKFHKRTLMAMDNLIIDFVNNNEREMAFKLAGKEYLMRSEKFGPEHEVTLYSMQQYLDLRDGNW